jgi:hypothetical protein
MSSTAGPMKRFRSAVLLTCLVFLVAGSGAWAVLALGYTAPGGAAARQAWAAAFAVATLATLVAVAFRKWRMRMLTLHLVLTLAVIAYFFSLEPSNERDWQTDVAALPYATVDGPIVTVHNIRNFDYRSETDYTPRYYDKVFDLRELEGVDLVAVYWMGPAIAHTIVSFAFAGGNHLAVSIETRKEKGEAYSTIAGFFRQYELYYVVADERDVIRLRTNYRHDPPEDVYVYRVQGPIENGRRFFMEYMRQLNVLAGRPQFYNTLTTNCTTVIWAQSLVNPEHLPFSWKILASGYVPEYLYESGRLDTSVPFVELQRRAHVNGRAQAADADPDFSRLIRARSGTGPNS